MPQPGSLEQWLSELDSDQVKGTVHAINLLEPEMFAGISYRDSEGRSYYKVPKAVLKLKFERELERRQSEETPNE